MNEGAISADEWRQIVDSAVGTAIITTDLEGRVTSWNAGASRMLGWSAADVLGETLERLFPPGKGAAALRQEMNDALTVGRGGGTEGWGQNKSSPKSYAKVERNRNDVVVRMCNIRSLWIAIDMRQF